MIWSLLLAVTRTNARQSRNQLATVTMNRLHPFQSSPASTVGPPTTPKPPNVLVFQWSKNSTNVEFIRTREALEKCLSIERYAIYPLGYDDIIGRTPWKDNCQLVVVPPIPGGEGRETDSKLAPKVICELITYLKDGGFLLSMNASLNEHFRQKPIPQKSADVSFILDDGAMLSPDSGVGGVAEVVTFHTIALQSHDNHMIDEKLADNLSQCISSRVSVASFEPSFEQNTNQCNNVTTVSSPSAADYVCVKSGGCAVVSGVDLLPLPEGETNVPLLVKLKKDVMMRFTVLGRLLGMLGLECSEGGMPDLTHTYLVCKEKDRGMFVSACSSLAQGEIIEGRETSLHLVYHDYQSGTPVDPSPCPNHSQMVLLTSPADWQLERQPFNFNEYFRHLQTKKLGRTLLYTAVIPSTQTLFTGNIAFCNTLTTEMGVVNVAGQQTKGKGRSGNVWLSPKGSMMFSTALKLRPSSRLGERLPLLQHLVAMAVVHGIRSSPGYEDLPIQIKWPNDIYYKDQVKLGGILVTSFSLPGSCQHTAVIGCGVNVDNKHPTMSLNDCIAVYNATSGCGLSPVSVEWCLAATLSSLESLLLDYEARGMEGMEELYYHYWLHSGSVVRLSNYGNKEAVITGIDQYGYLLVRLRENGAELSLQPDGNSFDIMKGLIAMKQTTSS